MSETQPSPLIELLLRDQRDLTPAARFAQWHETAPSQGPQYRDLIPLSAPKPDEQYGFEVNLDACSGCKACVTACHSLNGLDDEECWRQVGRLVSHDEPFLQTVTAACHHCVDPACLNGCPVLAYDKDPVTGIVRHLDDQCIGCQYCIFTCPYDVPKYSPSRGIVRKCDMCQARLGAGEPPACAQACPSGAITITFVRARDLSTRYRPASAGGFNSFLPQSPPPDLTLPTTRYVTTKEFPADLADFVPQATIQPAHWPLVWMLTLTQAGAGAFLFLPLLSHQAQAKLALLGTLFTSLGLVGSVLHLGKPLKAWRAFLNLRRSWLSREIVLLTLFLLLGGLSSLGMLGLFRLSGFSKWIVASSGLVAVYSSAMVYVATRRSFWTRARTDFFLTTVLLGCALGWLTTEGEHPSFFVWGTFATATVILGRLIVALRSGARATGAQPTPLLASASLMRTQLKGWVMARVALALAGCLCGLILESERASAAFLCLVASEFVGRLLFFRAVVPWRMPGGSV